MDIYRIMNGLVDNSTSETLNAPDVNAMREVSELVRSRADMPKEVIKLINNKLMKRDKKVTLLCLELLEYLTYACEITLYNQISTKDFLLKIGTLLKSHDLGEIVINRACRLIKCWRDLFNKELHQMFFQFYDNVVKKGIEIPSNYVSPYANLKGNPPPSNNTGGFKPSAAFSNSSSAASKQPVPTSGPKAKLRSDLELIKQNITLVNDMIDNQDPRKNVEQNDSLNDLMPTLKKQEAQMQQLIEKLAIENDESLLELCLQLNDDLLSTQERYQSLKRHMKPKPFRGKVVEDDVLQQIEKLEISSGTGANNNNNGFSPSIFSETAQALNSGVSKAQIKIPPPSSQVQQQNTQQPAAVTQALQKPATNLLDLLDDDEPVPVPQQIVQQPVVQQQQQQQVQFQNGFNNPNTQQVNNSAVVNGGGQPSLTQLYNQSANLQNQQQAQQNKYSALNTFGQPNVGFVNPNVMGGYNPAAVGGMGMGMGMGVGMNPQVVGYNTMNAGGIYNTMQQQQQPTGYGMPPTVDYNTASNLGYGMGGGYGATSQVGGYGGANNGAFMNTNTGGYGGGLPATSPMPNINKNGGYGTSIAKKDAFDDLDDMFGIGGSGTTNATSNVSSNQQSQVQQSNVQKQTVDFDLF